MRYCVAAVRRRVLSPPMRVGGVIAVAVLLGTVGPRGDARAEGQAELHGNGAVELTWHGRPGSCDAVGLCDVTGSVRFAPRQGAATFVRDHGEWKLDYVSAYG